MEAPKDPRPRNASRLKDRPEEKKWIRKWDSLHEIYTKAENLAHENSKNRRKDRKSKKVSLKNATP